MLNQLNFSPIIERELRLVSKRPITYWGRVGAAGLAIFFGWTFIQAQQTPRLRMGAGQLTFGLLAGIAALLVVMTVIQSAAEAFSREKKEDTLGLLFLTPLRPFEVALGKLVSTSLPAFYRFVAMIPVLGLPILAGGVGMMDFLVLVLGLLHLVLFSAALGLCCSAHSWDEKVAATMATCFLLFFVILLPAMITAVGAATGWGNALALTAFSPAYPVFSAAAHRTGDLLPLGMSLFWTQALSATFFYLTCRVLPVCWRNRPGSQPVKSRQNSASEPLSSKRPRRRMPDPAQRARWLDLNPIIWLASRKRPSSTWAWITGTVAMIVPGISILETGELKMLFSPVLVLFVCYLINAGIKSYVTTQASHALAYDQAEDPLQLLITTPLKSAELANGFFQAIQESVRPWARRTLWAEGIWLVASLALHAQELGKEIGLFALAGAAILGFLIPDLHAVAWHGLWQGVATKKGREAEQESTQVLLAPWGLLFLFALVVLPMLPDFSGTLVCILAWMALSGYCNRRYSRKARHNLESQLELWARRRALGEMENYDRWKRFGRWLGRWIRTIALGRSPAA